MHGEPRLIVDLAIVVVGGFAAAVAARALRLPILAGYLLVGIALGPSGLGLARDFEMVSSVAEIGVALLMFAVGAEMSLRRLWRLKAAAFVAAPLQILLSVVLGYALGNWAGLGFAQGMVLGFVVALSSTMVVLKMLSARGELHTRHGETMVAILLVQDLAAVIMVAALPALPGAAQGREFHVLALAGKGFAFVLWVLVLARWIVPAIMHIVTRSYSKEVFVVTVAALCFAGAASGYWLGFSVALGAFAAGLVVSDSHYSHEAVANIVPLRDLFGMVFFVSLGLLIDLRSLAGQLPLALAVLALMLVGKPLATAASILVAREGGRTALLAGLGLAQVGEFSFLVATLGFEQAIITSRLHSLLLALAGISLLATPGLMMIGGWVDLLLHKRRLMGAQAAPTGLPTRADAASPTSGHVILCGFGRVGRLVGEALLEEREPVTVIECDQHVVTDLRSRGAHVLFGDASNRVLLEAAGAAQARAAVIALPEGLTTLLAVRELRRINPHIPIVARVHFPEEVIGAYREGATRVVFAEFEAGLELMRHALLCLDREPSAVQEMIERARRTKSAEWAEEGE